jgi:hypothetical protein
MDMINQLPNYDIGGEHEGQFNILYDLLKAFERTRRLTYVGKLGSAWYNRMYPTKDFLCWTQSWFQITTGWKPKYSPQNVHGFKEIRYNRTEVLDFIHQVFPCAKFIVNMRKDLQAQHKSNFKSLLTIKELRSHNDVLLDFARNHSSQTRVMMLEDYQNKTLWNDLFAWLGKPNCKANKVLHSNKDKSYEVDNRKVVVCD